MSNENNESNEKHTRRHGGAGVMRTVFGIFMIVIYVGMGVLFLIDFFGWKNAAWGWLRWALAALLIAYGLWRAYRQFAGIDFYANYTSIDNDE